MAFTEQLLFWKLEDGDERSDDELDTVPASVLLQVVELLGEMLVCSAHSFFILQYKSLKSFKGNFYYFYFAIIKHIQSE